ncbi:hypothetical protein [Brachybacterium paraconglomeratum]|uniref:hypothetical protein n=1 Tax=Brachybacterium paraconglomeratum TaxID=173362 RepID=UPI0002E8DB15|nr:hypothetical protein [Brachybacterium paraconglomeratum]
MTRYELTLTAFIVVHADSEEDAVENARPLATIPHRYDGVELHISEDDIANADIEELSP